MGKSLRILSKKMPSWSVYVNTVHTYFALAAPPNKRHTVRIRGWWKCREQLVWYFADQLRRFDVEDDIINRLERQIAKKEVPGWVKDKEGWIRESMKPSLSRAIRRRNILMPTKEACLVAFFRPGGAPEERRVTESIKTINAIEKYVGIRGRTKADRITNKENMYLYQGPSFWTKAPHLLSLYMLLIRTAGTGKRLCGLDTIEKIDKAYTAKNGLPIACYRHNPDDTRNFLPQLGHGKLVAFLDNYKKIYRGFTQKKIFSVSGGSEGVSKIVKGQSNIGLVKKRTEKLWKKHHHQ